MSAAPRPTLRFRVYGIPAPQGSKQGFAFKRRDGRLGVAMKESSEKVTPWRQDVAAAALEAARQAGLGSAGIDWPVIVEIRFLRSRPKSHYGARGLRPSAPRFPHGKPDVDKLGRSTLDGLIVLRDDSLVVDLIGRKRYAERDQAPGAYITIEPA